MNRFFRSALFPLIILVVLAWVAMNTLTGNDEKVEKATYSDLVARVQDNPESIEQVTVNPRKQEIARVEGTAVLVVSAVGGWPAT